MAKTKIEWATHTWNPVTGCSPVSEGCSNCYAKRMAKRLAGKAGYPKDDPFKVTLHPDKLDEPFRWKKPRNVFVVSMGDLFHEDVPDDWILKVFDVIGSCPQHIFMILTKRPEQMKEFIEKLQVRYYNICSPIKAEFRLKETPFFSKYKPIKNLWLGVTAENQKRADERIPILLQIPAAVRFVSVEPMLGPVDLSVYLEPGINKSMLNPEARCGHHGNLLHGKPCIHCFPDRLNWVICGGESGPSARPMHPDWARSLRDQCQTAGVPFFLKQWGEFMPDDTGEGHPNDLPWVSEETDRSHDQVIDMQGVDCTNWEGPGQIEPFALMRHVGKKRAGRLLDGQVWDQFPGDQG